MKSLQELPFSCDVGEISRMTPLTVLSASVFFLNFLKGPFLGHFRTLNLKCKRISGITQLLRSLLAALVYDRADTICSNIVYT